MKYAFFPGCAHDTSAGYKESLDAICRKLDVDLLEIPDWNCCGATITAGESKTSSLYLAARSFALSEKMGHTHILTGCNACYTTLKKSARFLKKEQQLNDANQHLSDEGLALTEEITVQHVMDVIFEKTSPEVWDAGRSNALHEINIACYYGCQYTRPWITGPESDRPQYMEKFISALGFNAINHSAKTICCGAAGAMRNAGIATTLVGRITDTVISHNADAIITICPLCQFNVDSYQTRPDTKKVPVLFFSQLLGLYLDIAPDQLGMDKLLVDADGLIKKMQTLKSS